MICGLTPGAAPTTAEAVYNRLVVDLNEDDGVEIEGVLVQNRVKGLGLGERARIAVHHETLRPIIAVKTAINHFIDEGVGDKLSLGDVRLCLLAGRRSISDGFAQHIAGADVDQAEPFAE